MQGTEIDFYLCSRKAEMFFISAYAEFLVRTGKDDSSAGSGGWGSIEGGISVVLEIKKIPLSPRAAGRDSLQPFKEHFGALLDLIPRAGPAAELGGNCRNEGWESSHQNSCPCWSALQHFPPWEMILNKIPASQVDFHLLGCEEFAFVSCSSRAFCLFFRSSRIPWLWCSPKRGFAISPGFPAGCPAATRGNLI